MFLTKTEVKYKMMPLVPTSTALKPKIGFSIDSIVGDHHAKASMNFSPNSDDSAEQHQSPFSDYYGNDLRMRIQRERDVPSPSTTPPPPRPTSQEPALQRRRSDYSVDFIRNATNSSYFDLSKKDSTSTILSASSSTPKRLPDAIANTENMSKIAINAPLIPQKTPSCDNSPVHRSRSPSPTCGKRPILVPGIPANLVRPFPVGVVASAISPEIKSIPPYLNSPEMITTHPNPHFLAAQFQMAAALAHGPAGPGYPPGAAGMQHHPGHPSMHPREGYPLYPWLLSRHGRIFPHRFPGNFLLQPFRKPKRVRTAFSPSQLLKLEHAFESNHYVVGSERKTLAQNLSLSETQVKVWFQNRRTKHKRMQQEGESKGSTTNLSSSPSNNNDGSQISYDEDDELIDMEMEDECASDEEIENQQRQQQYLHRQ